MEENEGWLSVGVAAAMAKSHAEDQRGFLRALARMLESSLPGHVEVVRGGFPLGPRPIREVRVTLGDRRYSLADAGAGPLQARRTLVKRGIALQTDELPVSDWIAELGAALQEYAQAHGEAAAALRRFLE